MNANVFCTAAAEKIQRQLTINEKELIKSYLANLKISPHTSIKLAFKYHLERVCAELSKHKPKQMPIFNKDTQIAMLGKNSEADKDNYVSDNKSTISEAAKLEALFLLEASDAYDLSKAIAPKSKLKYNYLTLDSNNCFEIPESRDKFTWLIQEEHTVLQKGYINLHAKMRNIVMARIGRMTFAHMYDDFTNDVLNKHRFAFGIEEFASQALIVPTGTKFQFVAFLSESDRNYGTTTVISPFNCNRGWFRFREPFKMLDKLTLTVTNLNMSTKVVLPDESFSFPAIHNSNQRIPGRISPIYINNANINLPLNYEDTPLGIDYQFITSVQGNYVISGYNSGNTIVDATWNGNHSLIPINPDKNLYPDTNSWYRPIGTIPPPPYLEDPPFIEIPFTITLQYKPRFTGVLELISLDDSDDVV